MEPIITSILDTDLYKMSMMQSVLELYPDTVVSYKFKNRGKHRFNKEFFNELQKQIWSLEKPNLTQDEYNWLKDNVPYFKLGFLEYLKNFRFNPSCVSIDLDENDNLELDIQGLWIDTILYEVPLMAIISELYFKIIDKLWNTGLKDEKYFRDNFILTGDNCKMSGQGWQTFVKAKNLSDNNCYFAEYGTRRRRSFEIQNEVIRGLIEYGKIYRNSTFVGTSNLYFAKKYGLKPIGTMGHEIIMATSVLYDLRHANRFAMENWQKVYNGNLGIFLPDTYGIDAFLDDFDLIMAKLYDGIRHDSGDWKEFTNKIIKHYKKLKIDPMTKTIVFSDSLNVDKAIEIKKYCEGKIKYSFGIGTHFTNDVFNSSPLNIVIKLNSVYDKRGREIPVCKLSDDIGKAQGDPKAIEIAKWTFFQNPLNS